MHKRAFEAALRAALKITFSTTLVACGGTVDQESPATDVDKQEPGTPSASRAAGGAGGAGGAGEGGGAVAVPTPTGRPRPAPHPPEQCEDELVPPVDWWTYDAHTFTCCAQWLDAMIPEGDPTAWVAASLGDVAIDNCCTQVVWTGAPPTDTATPAVVEACCTLKTGTPSCIAWGPPMPPVMDAADWDAWLALQDEVGADLARVA